MKIKFKMKAMVYKAVQNVFEDKRTGRDVPYYKVIVEQDGEVASISCSDAVFNNVTPMTENNLLCEYDTESKKLRVTGIGAK